MTTSGDVVTKTITNQSIATVGTSPIALIAADPNRRYLLIHNPSDTIKIAIAPPGVTAAINGAGGITLLPYGTFWCENNFDPTCAFTVISSGGSNNPVTVWVA